MWLWVEISTPRISHARYKVYQLFQAHMALRPDKAKAIMAVIFLNAEKDDAIAFAAQLRDNHFIQRQTSECKIHITIAWTNHRNIYSAMNRVEVKLEKLDAKLVKLDKGQEKLEEKVDKGLEKLEEKVDKGLKDLRDDIHTLSMAINGFLDLQRPWPPLHMFKGILNRYRASSENHREDLLTITPAKYMEANDP
jgi:hypothetical protein